MRMSSSIPASIIDPRRARAGAPGFFSSLIPPSPLLPLRSIGAFFLGSCALATPALAQDLTHKAPPQQSPITIHNATIHPVSGPEIQSGFITFDKGIITAIGSGPAPTKQGAIDAKGAHIYPGLIAAVTRLGLTEIPTVRAMRDSDETGSLTPEAKTIIAVNPDSTLLPVTRAAGILTAGVFPGGGLIGGCPSAIRLDGWTNEDMAVSSCLGVYVNYPSARAGGGRRFQPQADAGDQGAAVRRNLDALDEVFKTARAYAAARDSDPSTPIDIRWESIRCVFAPSSSPQSSGAGVPTAAMHSTSSSHQLPVFLQASEADQITQAVTWAISLDLKPVIVGGRDAAQCADLLKRHNVPVIVQGVHNLPRRDDSPYDSVYSMPAQLESLGITWCLASGEETPHERNLAANAGRAAAYGLSRDAALRSITLAPAQILGIADTLGSLEKGKSATLVITDGDILEVTTHVTRAFIDGREIDLSTKQSKLNEKYRERYRQTGDIRQGK